jgi:carbonic anhydrase
MSMRIATVLIFGALAVIASSAYFRGPRPTSVSGEKRHRPTPDEAISILKEGNARFVRGNRKFVHLGKDRVAETAFAQEPFATLLACSDSRVPVENVFDAGIGDCFVVRVAGNVCSDHEVGSIEYAVQHLKTPLVVVLGHTGCGAVTAVVENADVRGKFPHLAEHILPAYEDAIARQKQGGVKSIIEEAVRCNVRRAIRDLLDISEGVRTEVENGNVKIVGAVYDLHTGSVDWLTPDG